MQKKGPSNLVKLGFGKIRFGDCRVEVKKELPYWKIFPIYNLQGS